MTDVLVYCDRCNQQIRDAFRTATATAGFYDVTPALRGKNHQRGAACGPGCGWCGACS